MLRKLISAALISALIFNSAGFLFLFFYAKKLAKEDAERLLKQNPPKELIVNFEFSASDLDKIQWIHEKEFRYQGMMFDVLRKEKIGEKLVVHCINDKKEEKLFDNLTNCVDSQTQDKVPLKNILKLIYSFLVSGIYQDNLFDLFDKIKRSFEFNDEFKPNQTIMEIPTPPPNFLSYKVLNCQKSGVL